MDHAYGRTGAGRKTKYKPEYAEQAYELCLLGYTDEQLARVFGVRESTLNQWKKAYPEFSESLRSGKDLADGKVAGSLYKRAIGFTYDEVTFEKIVTDDTAQDRISLDLYKKKVVTKMVVPDVGAAMNWLVNRQKALWRNKQEVTVTAELQKYLDDAVESGKLTPDHLQQISLMLADILKTKSQS